MIDNNEAEATFGYMKNIIEATRKQMLNDINTRFDDLLDTVYKSLTHTGVTAGVAPMTLEPSTPETAGMTAPDGWVTPPSATSSNRAVPTSQSTPAVAPQMSDYEVSRARRDIIGIERGMAETDARVFGSGGETRSAARQFIDKIPFVGRNARDSATPDSTAPRHIANEADFVSKFGYVLASKYFSQSSVSDLAQVKQLMSQVLEGRFAQHGDTSYVVAYCGDGVPDTIAEYLCKGAALGIAASICRFCNTSIRFVGEPHNYTPAEENGLYAKYSIKVENLDTFFNPANRLDCLVKYTLSAVAKYWSMSSTNFKDIPWNDDRIFQLTASCLSQFVR